MPVTVTTTVPAVLKVHEMVEVVESLVTLEGVTAHAELSVVRATVPEKPFRGDRVIVEVPGELTTTITAVGLAEIMKSGAGVTLKSTETECDREPLVPVTVTLTVPAVAKVQDKVDVPEPPVTVAVLWVQAELSDVSATSPVNPLRLVTWIVELPEVPTVVGTVVGLAVIEKSGRLATSTVTESLLPAYLLSPSYTPVMLEVPGLDELNVTVHATLPRIWPLVDRVHGLLTKLVPVDMPVWLNVTVPVGGREPRMVVSYGMVAVHMDDPPIVMLEGKHDTVVVVGRLLTVMMKGDAVLSLGACVWSPGY